MNDENGISICDFCGSDEGEFYAETGNHVLCQDKARELAALRDTVQNQAAQIERMRATLEKYADQKNWVIVAFALDGWRNRFDTYCGYELAERCLKELGPE